MATREEINRRIEIMQAYVDGKEIQRRYTYKDKWLDAPDPKFNWSMSNYRIKPEPREIWVVEDKVKRVAYGVHFSEKEAESYAAEEDIVSHYREVLDDE